MINSERLAIDIRHWGRVNPADIGSDIASFALEAGDRPLTERTNPVVLELTAFSKLVRRESRETEDVATKKILAWAETDTPAAEIWTTTSHPSEIEVLNALCDFADLNPGTIMVWVSPPKAGTYTESRIVAYQTIKINGQKYLFFRAVCSEHSTGECLEIAKQLSVFASPGTNPPLISNSGQLRATPLALTIPKEQTLTGFLSKTISGLPEVWKAIAKGNDLKEKIEALKVAVPIVDGFYDQIRQAESFIDQWEVGRGIEAEIKKMMGFRLRSGPCGGLYSDLSSPSSGLTGIFGVGISARNYLNVNEGSGKFIHNCGVCGKELKRHMIKGDKCPYCSGTYEGC